MVRRIVYGLWLSLLMFVIHSAEASSARARRELVEKRTLTSKTFDNGDGTYTTIISTAPMHYLDDEGRWQDIDTEIRPLNGAVPTGFDYISDANLFKIGFRNRKGASVVAIWIDTKQVGPGWTDVEHLSIVPLQKAVEQDGHIVFVERVKDVESVSVEGNKIRFYKQFGDDGDLVYLVERGALVQRIYLPRMPDLATKYENGWLVYEFLLTKSTRGGETRSFPLYVKGKLIESDTSVRGEMEFRSYYDGTILSFIGSKVYEARGTDRTYLPYEVKLTRWSGTRYWPLSPQSVRIISVKVPLSWLREAGRSFPVVIENKLRVKRYSRRIDDGRRAKIASLSEDLWLADCGSVYQYDANQYDSEPSIVVGRDDWRNGHATEKYRAWLLWDTSPIPDGSDIISATFELKCSDFESDSPITVKVWSMEDYPFPGTETTWNDCGNGTAYQSFEVTGWWWSGSFDNNENFNSAIENRLPEDWIAVGLKSENEDVNPSWAEFQDVVDLTVRYIPITVSNVQVDPYDTGAIISWNTDKPSKTIISWGASKVYTNMYLESTLKTSHSHRITEVSGAPLSPNTLYYFSIGTSAGGIADPFAYSGQFYTKSPGLYVPEEFPSIQSAIDAASSGQTVYVGPGTYSEQISMKDGVDLIGSGPSNTLIDVGTDYIPAISFNRVNAKVKGFKLRGYAAVKCVDSSPVIEGNDIYGSEFGIYCDNSDPKVKDNHITNCTYGIILYDHSYPEIRQPSGHNTIEGSGQGVWCLTSSQPKLGVDISGYWGNNNILTGGYDVWADDTCPLIYAQRNYWGDPNVPLIHGEVAWEPPLSGRAKVAAREPGFERYRELSLDLAEGDYAKAIAGLKEVIEDYPGSRVARWSLVELISAHMGMGKEEECLGYLEEVARRYSDFPLWEDALFGRVCVLRRLGFGQEALEVVLELLDKVRGKELEKDLLFVEGMIYKYNLKAYDKAEVIFREVLRRYSDELVGKFAKLELGCDPVGKGVSGAEEVFRVFPNPFNARMVVDFSLPEAGFVRLGVYDVLGKKLRTLVDGKMGLGLHRVVWDGRDDGGREVSSGVYVVRLEVGGRVFARKVVMVR